ncbi:hypothetical protein BSN85_26030 [Bradyrhizobium brasilense]|uniref:glycoside hydrolase family 88 protein n=1 Tax=Bradyrhizobium brasilense TaxID=1419277 RepID=UPI000976312D|nr:glycoside hydrolase family 88 protein [Bradyrhizobium brasilense]OMI04880.1 hypothetical protein BSN85_26030 [Bradyrhizobium brasilense]
MVVWEARWQSALDHLCGRVRTIHDRVGEAWPYHCSPGERQWDTTGDGDWCGGHWVECLRIVGELTGDSALLEEALRRTERLRPYLERDDMFRGHRFYYSAARQYAWTGQERYRTLALAAAYAVRSMAMPGSGIMPIGTQVQVRSTNLSGRDKACIDNVHPNLILDWWAYARTGDETFVAGARRHLDATIDDFVLADGSTIEFADYDTVSGRKVHHFTLLGAHDDSCWSRGQAWAIAGYLRAYEALNDARYLATGKKLLNYWVGHCDETLVPPYDFKDPQLADNPGAVPVDTSAAAVVVEQLARLALKRDLGPPATDALNYLVPMIDGLLTHLTPRRVGDLGEPGILLNGCFNYPKRYATHSELIWGTAYLLFALYYLKTGRIVE